MLVLDSQDPDLIPSTQVAAYNCLSLVPREPAALFDLHRYQAHTWCTYIYTNIHMHKINVLKIKKKLTCLQLTGWKKLWQIV